jgi:hypothetical protein
MQKRGETHFWETLCQRDFFVQEEIMFKENYTFWAIFGLVKQKIVEQSFIQTKNNLNKRFLRNTDKCSAVFTEY